VNIFSGTAEPTKLIESINSYPELKPLVDESVRRLLLEKFRLGLFENPYVDVDAAQRTIGKQEFQKKANIALRKSIVLLRNKVTNNSTLLPLKAGTKVYFETYQQQQGASATTVMQPEENLWDIELVDTPEKADMILLWLIPKSKPLFASDGSPLYVSLSKNGVDVQYINRLVAKKPSVVAINNTNPWVIDEIYGDESGYIIGVLATFGTTPEAILDVVTGKFAPSGKMPFSTPFSEQVAQNQKSDVPGYLEGPDYALFNFNEGLNY
jgi:beta-glucosidase